MQQVDWYNCFNDSWKSAPLLPEAYCHRARVPFGLAERIYRHMFTEGWLNAGDSVVDPFGGVAGCSFHAMLHGCHWTGVELEKAYWKIGVQNIDFWRSRYANVFPNYGTGRLLRGDSRYLRRVISAAHADAVIGSPPYADGAQHTGGPTRMTSGQGGYTGFVEYGDTPGQLAAMPVGSIEAVISSPPYAETRIAGHGDEGDTGLRMPDGSYPRGHEGWQLRKGLGARYGETQGNLGNLPAGDLDAVISSPPYSKNTVHHRMGITVADLAEPGRAGRHSIVRNNVDQHADTPGNLSNAANKTFWESARMIVDECYAILRPGGMAAWITGNYVRNKKLVPFSEQWLTLCQSAGFTPALWVTAWKEQTHGVQLDVFGNEAEVGVSRVSFFRRLGNRNNPEAAVRSEEVIFMQKPLVDTRG